MAKILIVDDDAPIRALLALAFKQAGFEVSTAGNGSEAISLFAVERFDAILSDVMMPLTNGHELARWVAEHFPVIPTVLMSGYDVGCEDCPHSGRCARLSKPFIPKDAVSLISRLLRQADAA